MRLVNHANLTAERLAIIESELPEQPTLLDVFNWGRQKASGALAPEVFTEVIVQDEFTHDAIVPWRDGLFLVYGAT